MKKPPQKVAYLSRNSVVSEIFPYCPTAQMAEFMFPNVAYRAAVYRTGIATLERIANYQIGQFAFGFWSPTDVTQQTNKNKPITYFLMKVCCQFLLHFQMDFLSLSLFQVWPLHLLILYQKSHPQILLIKT